MKKNSIFKAVAILLSMVVVAVSCVYSSVVVSFANGIFGSGKESVIPPTQMKGDYVAPYSLEYFATASSVSSIDTQKTFANSGVASVDKIGVDNSFALKLDGKCSDFAYIKLGDATNTLVRNKTYVISMFLKKSGKVNSFNSGVHIVSGNKLTEGKAVADSGVKDDKWIEYSFEYTPTANRTGWAHLYFEWDIAENSSLYIDDISVKLKNDASGHNIIPAGNFDRSIYIDGLLDSSIIENANYSFKNPVNASGFDFKKNEGFKGSFGAKLVRTSAADDVGYFEYDTQGVFANNTHYVIEFKAKKSAELTAFNILFREKAQDHTVLSLNSNALKEYLSDTDYVLYRVEYQTDGNASQGKSRLSFSIDGAEGEYILLDDISIYAKDDTEKKILFKNGSFDAMRIAANAEPEWNTIQIPYVIEDYDCIANYQAVHHLPQNPNASIDAIGVDGSYGLKLVGNGVKTTAYMVLGPVNTLKGGTEYIISMMVKKKGSLDSFRAGIVYDWKNFYNDFTENIGDDWYVATYKITPENNADNNTGWNHLILEWQLPAGSELYIDNISVVAVNDEHEKNIYTKGAFDATAHEESIADERELADTYYTPAVLGAETVNSQVVEHEGYRGSYALKMAGTGSQIIAKVRYDSRPGLQNYTEYYLEFKAKRSGNVSYFSAGIQEQWTNHNALIFGNKAVVEERISDDFYNYYRIKYTTDGNALGSDGKGAWTFITFTFTADVDSYVLIDDVKVYATTGENITETFRKGAFDNAYYELELDNAPDGNYIPRNIEEYTTRHNFYVTGTKEEIDKTISIAENEGVKGSSAFKIEGTGVNNSFKISANSLSELNNGCYYKIGLKVKMVKDSNVRIDATSFFRYGLIEQWSQNYLFNFGGEKLAKCITDEYHYYQAVYKTNNSCDHAWSYLIFNYNLPEGVSLYIDDIELIPVSDGGKWITDAEGNGVNLFRKSTFDMKDLGQDSLNKSETAPEGIMPMLSYQYSTLKPEIIAVDDAPSGKYCLSFGFKDEAISGEHMMYITPSMPGETYKISFWVKVIGEGQGAFYMSDGRWLNHTYGKDFNQYETGKWTKFELIYNDRTTPYEAVTYRRLKFEFNGPAGSGMLVDNITCVRIDCDYESFDVLSGGKGDFESSETYPEIAWDKNDRFIYKEGE